MTDTQTPPLAVLIDAHGHRVTVQPTRSGLLTILTTTPAEDRRSGQPCLNPENAATLRDALNEYLATGGAEAGAA